MVPHANFEFGILELSARTNSTTAVEEMLSNRMAMVAILLPIHLFGYAVKT
jgi:hypothetical protein